MALPKILTQYAQVQNVATWPSPNHWIKADASKAINNHDDGKLDMGDKEMAMDMMEVCGHRLAHHPWIKACAFKQMIIIIKAFLRTC